MADETMSLPDSLAVEYGFAPASTGASEPVTTDVPKETPAADASPVATPTATEKPAESVSPKPAEAQPTGEEKPLYTPDEIRQLCKEAESTGKINLDTSRLDPNGIALMKSFQQGLDGSWGKAKREKEEAARVMAEAQAKLAEFDRRQKEIENQRIFQKETEELGPEEAERRKEIREIKEEQAQLRWERDQARQRETTMQISHDFRQVAPKFFIPEGDALQDLVLSRIVAGDMLRINNGEPPRTIEESAAQVADTLGFTNFDNLMKMVKANPENFKTLKNMIIKEYNIDKSKGPTVSPSSVVNVQTPQKPPGEIDATKSTIDVVRDLLNIPAGEEINLT